LIKLQIQSWKEFQVWVLFSELTTPWVVLAITAEFDNSNRPDDTSGMIVTALLAALFCG